MPFPPDILALERSVHGVMTFAPAEPFPDGVDLKYRHALGPRALIWALFTLKKHLRLLPVDQLDDFRTFFKKYDGAFLYAILDEQMTPRAGLTLARINEWRSFRRFPNLAGSAPSGTDPSDWLVIGAVIPTRLIAVYRGQPAGFARAGAIHSLTLEPTPALDPDPTFPSFGAMLHELVNQPADALALLGYSLDEHGACVPLDIQPSTEPVEVKVTRRGRR